MTLWKQDGVVIHARLDFANVKGVVYKVQTWVYGKDQSLVVAVIICRKNYKRPYPKRFHPV